MFSCRFLFRNSPILIPSDTLSASCKLSGKPPNVIKTFNTENKHLFGNLLESQTQRRKRVVQAAVNPDLVLVTKTDKEALLHDEAPKKRGRPKKTISVVPDDTMPSGHSTNNSHKDDVTKSDVSNRNSELTSQKSKQSKPGKDRLTKDEELPTVSSNECILKTVELVNKSSYALGDPDKLVNTQSSSSEESTSVLSANFVLKSAIPVNEISHPLDNPHKLVLSADSFSLESVLNYGFTHPLVKDYMKFPSVSKIMEDTMSPTSRMVLSKWRKNMVADLGEEGFAKHCIALKERGHEFHEAVRHAVLGHSSSEACHSEVTRNALRSLEWVLGLVTNPLALESIIAHPRLQYKGIPDCVAMFRGIPVVIDWKLSEKPKKDLKDTYDAPVQITAYMGALNHDPNYKWKVSHGLVAVAYTSGDPCDVFLLAPKHCEIYWRHWLLRFHKFNARSHLHLDHKIDEKALESV